MEITDEQRKRAEANRLAALEKRKRAVSAVADDPWLLFRCRKIPSPTTSSSPPDPNLVTNPDPPPLATRFRIFVEMCGPDEFVVTPLPLSGFAFPGESECFRRIDASLASLIPLRTVESQSNPMLHHVFKINDHESVVRCLKMLEGVELQDIPHVTLSVVRKFQDCVRNHWEPLLNTFYSDEHVDRLLGKLPKSLRDALLPFQLEGVRFGLRRGGRCLIADEMGLGKTIQAIAIACCFLDEGPILVVCPAVLRFSWAEELEHWLPSLLPKDTHLVFGHQDNLTCMEKSPKVVVISYKMLSRLRKSMLERKWALLIVDESHNIRCTKKKSESVETQSVLEVAAEVNHIILLSGTPSLSRPFDIYHQISMLWPRLLGKDKYEFAKNYCLMKVVQGSRGKIYQDFSKGIRLEELNVLLSQTVMIRRLKEHVLTQLPPKRRQIIRLKLKKADMPRLTFSGVSDAVCENEKHLDEFVMNRHCSDLSYERNENLDQCDGKPHNLGDLDMCNDEEHNEKTLKQLTRKEIGLAKLCGFREWFSNHAMIRKSNDTTSSHQDVDCQKMVIFAHHLKVLDGIQEFICEKGVQFVRIDGSTLARDRQAAVEAFRQSKQVKIAIIGITAGGIGLDFSTAHNVVFLELPKSASEMLQAEDRAHRRGQTNAVNIYIFCAKGTLDESHWLQLNRSLFRVSSMINGKDDAIREIEVDRVFHLDSPIASSLINKDNCTTSVNWGTESIKMSSDRLEECRFSNIERIEGESCSIEINPLQLETETEENMDSNFYATPHRGVVVTDYGSTQNEQSGTVPICSTQKRTSGFDLTQVFTTKAQAQGSATNNCEGDSECIIQPDSLRFEVSQYTGRIHLYMCMPGKDMRPRPLLVNFRPEDLEVMLCSASDAKSEIVQQFLKKNPACYEIFLTFDKEWNGLKPLQQNKLLGKPLQLPLSLELCYLKESINHESGGLLRGGSKRRVTPLCSISSSLPDNAVWKKVSIHSSTAKKKEYVQAWTITDEPLCKLCQQHCNGKLAKTPEYFEDLFCKLSCYQEYRIRTSQRSLREELFQVEHGICSECKLDCHSLVTCIKPLSIVSRKKYIESVAPNLAKEKMLFDKLVNEPVEGNAWHADHIIPVYKGGGECSLDNMRTLCVVCHAEVTKAQQADRKLARRRAKEQLKNVLKELADNDHKKPTYSNLDGIGERDDGVEAAQDNKLLFIKVPGSSYSRIEESS